MPVGISEISEKRIFTRSHLATLLLLGALRSQDENAVMVFSVITCTFTMHLSPVGGSLILFSPEFSYVLYCVLFQQLLL